MAALSQQAQSAAQAVRALPDEDEKANVVRALSIETFPTGDKYKTDIWRLLLIGLFAVAIAAIVATVILDLNNQDSTAPIALASAVVAGVIGLFANSPTST